MQFEVNLLNCYRVFATKGDEIYSDISVEVEGEIFPCHRFVLAACSPYFQGLFRFPTYEQETKRNIIKLKDMSCEIFRIIYRFLYHHVNELKEENLLDVWSAADFLQIDCILAECKKFATKTINKSNYVKYILHVRLVDTSFMPTILEFITHNFDRYKDSEFIMELEGKELMSVVRDPCLRTCREENVVNLILKWVNYPNKNICLANATDTENQDVEFRFDQIESVTASSESSSDRYDFLIPLLSLSRLSSLKVENLNSLLHDQRTVNNTVRDLITMTNSYKYMYNYSYRPTFLCCRKNYHREDIVLMSHNKGKISTFNLTRLIEISIFNSPSFKPGCILTVHKGQLYGCCYTDSIKHMLSLFIWEKESWEKVRSLRFSENSIPQEFPAGQNTLWSFSIGEFLFVVHATKIIYQCDPLRRISRIKPLIINVPTEWPIVYATYFESLILVICRDPNDIAMLNVYDTTKKEWAETVSLFDVKAQNITSFYKEDKLYFLTSEYKLFVVESVEGRVTFQHVTTFPGINEQLLSAVVYCEDLFIFAYTNDPCYNFCEIHRNVYKCHVLFNEVRVFQTRYRYTSCVIGQYQNKVPIGYR